MTTNVKIKEDIQSLTPNSELVDLYTLDATSLGGSIYRFTPMTNDGSSVYFGGIEYSQLPVEFEGWEIPGDGRMPRPKMRVANVNLTFVAFVNSYRDGIGAKVTRMRTFKKYIDGEAGADSSAEFPRDIFYIEQKTTQNKHFIEWELISPFDIGNRQLPKNQVIPYCQHRYRIYDGGLVYTYATCPYTGSNYFKRDGAVATISTDVCGKKLSDCQLRYPNKSDILPFKGFPLIGLLGAAYR